MVFALQGYLIFSTARKRDQALNQINSEKAGRQTWGVETSRATSAPFGASGFVAVCEVRFVTETDADQVWSELVTFANKQGLQPGSWLTLHDCTHDEGSNVCVITNRQDW